jgi:hypothetical protein
MVITFQGENYFKIQSGDLVVLIDPPNQRSFKGASAVVNTVRPALAEPPVTGGGEPAPFWIDRQGEYEVSGIHVTGWTTEWVRDEEHTAYRISLDGIDVAVLGYLTRELDQKIQGPLGGTDILIVPAGGKPFLAPSSVAKIVRQVEPSVVIPGLFSDPKPFLKELGDTKTAPQEKLTVKKKDLPPKAMAVQLLSA